MFEFVNGLFAAGFAPWLLLLLFIVAAGGFWFFAFRFLVLQKFFSELWDFLKELLDVILPKKWDSAKTLIWLGFFSWAVSLFVGSTAQTIISISGWIFLIGGVHWAMHEEKGLKELLTIGGVFIGPWITGALICYFLFATPERIPHIAFILWPLVSAVIAGLPKFIGSDGVYKTPIWVKPKPDDRQYLVNMTLINLLLSCWIQLWFSTAGWLAQYPSLRADDMQNSSFVIQTQPTINTSSRGADILSRVESTLETTLEGQSWSQVERWLLNFDEQVATLNSAIVEQLPKAQENAYWDLKGKILPGEYNLQMFAIWNGPSSRGSGYYYTKTCNISRVVPIDVTGGTNPSNPSLPMVGNAKVQCGPLEGPTQGQPPV